MLFRSFQGLISVIVCYGSAGDECYFGRSRVSSQLVDLSACGKSVTLEAELSSSSMSAGCYQSTVLNSLSGLSGKDHY